MFLKSKNMMCRISGVFWYVYVITRVLCFGELLQTQSYAARRYPLESS